jgi:hypothetical protein
MPKFDLAEEERHALAEAARQKLTTPPGSVSREENGSETTLSPTKCSYPPDTPVVSPIAPDLKWARYIPYLPNKPWARPSATRLAHFFV